ncbi:MAG TPA: DUF427 domain-containing protein [Gaiellaceae bacterium]|nr:DUF427 domain-containing protein [Gaiellaceae bacterium]
MSLTAGTGPFGKEPAGRFNFEPKPPGGVAIYWDPVPYRVRALVDGQAVADSRRAHLLHETGHLPVYYFPPEDVREDVLAPSETRTNCPHKGDATHHSLQVDVRLVADAAWVYPEPIDSVAFIAGHVAFYWDKIDEWLAEDTPAFAHPRDPYHRIDVYDTRRRVRVLLDGKVLADSVHPKMLVETGHPPRFYLPRHDVSDDLLEPSETTTKCAYKGLAAHFSALGQDDVAWTYPEPLYDGEPVRDLIAFYGDRVELELDPLPEESPHHAGLVERLVAEEHHIQEIAKVGYEPATLPILLVVIAIAVGVIVFVALAVSITVYYLS